ncbi:MAG TPA: class I SAM-dependent methyltransferase [Bacteroidales bacterium]|nr:class I SAM-dependent methyltransferase [Bacteroidales bacterium]
MKEAEAITSEVKSLIDLWEPRLGSVNKEILSSEKNDQNRTIKQILGHLIDSTSNNTHRIVHLHYQESPFSFPNYATFGNNDRWIAIQNYKDEDWNNMIQLWKYSLLHFCHLVQNVDDSKLEKEWISAPDTKITLKTMIVDFNRHLKLHLSEIEELLSRKSEMTSSDQGFKNTYSNQTRAESYSKLEFPNTYYLAYRDLPKIISEHITGKKAVDFGCGTGRSTRFLKQLGFDATGIDISESMIRIAKELDKEGDYRIVTDGNYKQLGSSGFDIVQSIFTFDNIPGWENRTTILKGLRDLLKPTGKLICLDSTPELYVNEWASFSTMDFPENNYAKTGDIVRDIMLDVEDRSPIEDIFWTLDDYHKLFSMAGLKLEATYKPLGLKEEPYDWKSELKIAPWIIFVLGK